MAAALESILSQTFDNFEAILINDGSTDESGSIIDKFAARDRRIQVYHRPNSGIVGALNEGLSHARGEYVARMDADDIAMPDRFAKQMEHMRNNSTCVALGTAVLFTDPEGRSLKEYRPPLSHEGIEEELLSGNGGALIHPTAVFRKQAMIQSGGYREEYKFIEDMDLYFRLSEYGELSNLGDVLLHYRQHAHSINHLLGHRSSQVAEIIGPFRERKGLCPLEAKDVAEASPFNAFTGNWRRKWALEAAEGGNYRTARVNAIHAVCRRPWNRSNWSCLRYVAGLRGS